jgi:hypothetical protein
MFTMIAAGTSWIERRIDCSRGRLTHFFIGA